MKKMKENDSLTIRKHKTDGHKRLCVPWQNLRETNRKSRKNPLFNFVGSFFFIIFSSASFFTLRNEDCPDTSHSKYQHLPQSLTSTMVCAYLYCICELLILVIYKTVYIFTCILFSYLICHECKGSESLM